MSELFSFKEKSRKKPVLQYIKPGASNTIKCQSTIPIFADHNILLQPYIKAVSLRRTTPGLHGHYLYIIIMGCGRWKFSLIRTEFTPAGCYWLEMIKSVHILSVHKICLIPQLTLHAIWLPKIKELVKHFENTSV